MSLNKPHSTSLMENLRNSGLAISLVASLAALSSTACDTANNNSPIPTASAAPNKSPKTDDSTKKCPEFDTTKVMCDQLNKQVHSSLFKVSPDGKMVTDLCDSDKEYPKCQFQAANEESNCSNCDENICNVFVENDQYVYPMQFHTEPQVATRLRLKNGTLAICLDPPKKYNTFITNRRRFKDAHTDPDAGISTSAGTEHTDRVLLNEQIDHSVRADRLKNE